MAFKKTQNLLSWVVITSEVSHVFCCVLPSAFSILTLMVGMGLISTMPIWMDDLHHVMHDYEIPMMIISAIVLILGWGIHYIARKIDCRDNSCCAHEPCAPKKIRSFRILKIATILFAVNVFIYTTFHMPTDEHAHNHDSNPVAVHSDHDDHHHDH